MQAALLDGAALSWPWAIPFVGLLLAVALAPSLRPCLLARHCGKIAASWSATAVAAIALSAGITTARDTALHAMLTDYLSLPPMYSSDEDFI